MRFLRNMNATLRGFLIIIAIVLVVMLFQLYTTLVVVSTLLSLAFFLAIAFFVYMLWRERRGDIEVWSGRSRLAFYGAALLLLVNLGAYFWRWPHRIVHVSGLPGVAWLLVFPICIYAMVRVWRDEHRYG
jgi:hypothetical protein